MDLKTLWRELKEYICRAAKMKMKAKLVNRITAF